MKTLQFEAVLPVTGRFLSIREPVLADYFACAGTPNAFLGIMLRCAKIDGEAVTLDQINGMELREAGPMINWLNGLATAMENKGVA